MIGACAIAIAAAGSFLQAGLLAPPLFSDIEERPTERLRITGNGGLTVGVNVLGGVGSCRWPSPGYYDQITCLTVSDNGEDAVTNTLGMAWGVKLAQGTHWLSGVSMDSGKPEGSHASGIIETTRKVKEQTFTQWLFVHPARDLLVAHLRVEGAQEAPRIFWFQNLTPCTRLLPGVPVAGWAFDSAKDFAAFVDRDLRTVFHFRPSVLTGDAWERARRLTSNGASAAAWAVFGDGVWAVSGSDREILDFALAGDDAPLSVLDTIASGDASGPWAVTGQTQSAMELEVAEQGGAYTATVFVAFASKQDAALQSLRFARARGVDVLKEETEAYWRKWSENLSPIPDHPELMALRRDALRTLELAQDKHSGAVVRAVAARPALAYAAASEGAWITLALDLAGKREAAQGNALFYVDALRDEDKRGRPAGSLAAALHANGVEAAPQVFLDANQVSWALSGLYRHVLFLSPQQQRALLRPVWDKVAVAMDFLCAWHNEETGEPLPSFNWGSFRDRTAAEDILLQLMGVHAGLRLAECAGRPAGMEWEERQRALESLVRFRDLNNAAPWTIDGLLPYWLEAIIPAGHRIWGTRADSEGEVKLLREMPFPVARVLAAAWPRYPDALDAALRLIAVASEVYQQPKGSEE